MSRFRIMTGVISAVLPHRLGPIPAREAFNFQVPLDASVSLTSSDRCDLRKFRRDSGRCIRPHVEYGASRSGRDDRSHEAREPKCSFDCAFPNWYEICSEDRENQGDTRADCSRSVSPPQVTDERNLLKSMHPLSRRNQAICWRCAKPKAVKGKQEVTKVFVPTTKGRVGKASCVTQSR